MPFLNFQNFKIMQNNIKILFGGKHFLIVIFSVFSLAAHSQQMESSVQREGFVIGFGAGAGVISIADSNAENPFDEAQGSISFPNLKIGWMLNDRTALLATFPGLIYEYEGHDRSFESIMPSLQYWVTDKWWINGGIGLAMDAPAFYDYEKNVNDNWHFGCAVAASTGYEIYQNKNFTIDLQSRIHLGRVFMDDDLHRDAAAFSVGVGFNWY